MCVNGFPHPLTQFDRPLPSLGMRLLRILFWPLLAVLLMPGTASAAPGDPYVVYTANSFASGAVILRTEPGSGALVEVSRNGPQGNLFQRPYDLALERSGALIVADLGSPCIFEIGGEPCTADGRVIRVDPLTGNQSLVASGNQLVDPAGVAIGPGGEIWIADNLAPDDNGRIVRIDPSTGAQTTVAEGGRLDLPFGIAIEPGGSLVVSNRESPARIPRACNPVGSVVRVDPVTGDQQLVSQAGDIALPLGLAVQSDGSLVVANECPDHGGLIRVDPLGGAQSELTSNNDEDVLVTPERIAFDPGGALLVSDFNLGPDSDGGIVRVDPATGTQSLVRAGELFNHPLGIAAVVNRPPVAVLSLDASAVAAGRQVRLDASRSNDPEALRLVYEWDLDGDGSFEAGSGTTPTATRTFGTHGTTTVRVRVNDPHGGRAVAEGTVSVDGSLPIITQLRVGSRALGVGRRGRRALASARRPPRATNVSFNLSEPAAVALTIERARLGRRSPSGRCRVRARRGRRCIRRVPVRTLRHDGAAGANSIRVPARGLRPGRYRLLLTAVDAVGNTSAQRKLPLRVVRLRAARAR
jgi:DNA-binding beta-propeller fold protein YncE